MCNCVQNLPIQDFNSQQNTQWLMAQGRAITFLVDSFQLQCWLWWLAPDPPHRKRPHAVSLTPKPCVFRRPLGLVWFAYQLSLTHIREPGSYGTG
jgi:hypothetical protein